MCFFSLAFIETVYCTLYNKKWQSRGFLFGPVCPIYGVGAICGFALVDTLNLNNCPPLEWWQVIIIGFFGSAVLEYSTSLLLEKLFHAYWWDYSDLPLNIQGRISLFTSLGFALAGLLVVYVLYPFCAWLFGFISGEMVELIALIFASVLAVDLTLTISSLSDIIYKMQHIDENINERMTDLVESMYKNTSYISRSVISRIKGVRFKKIEQSNLFKNLIEKIRK